METNNCRTANGGTNLNIDAAQRKRKVTQIAKHAAKGVDDAELRELAPPAVLHTDSNFHAEVEGPNGLSLSFSHTGHPFKAVSEV